MAFELKALLLSLKILDQGVGGIKCFMSHEKVKDHLSTCTASPSYYHGLLAHPLAHSSLPASSSLPKTQSICNEFGSSSRYTQEDFNSQSSLLCRRDREKKIPWGGSVYSKD